MRERSRESNRFIHSSGEKTNWFSLLFERDRERIGVKTKRLGVESNCLLHRSRERRSTVPTSAFITRSSATGDSLGVFTISFTTSDLLSDAFDLDSFRWPLCLLIDLDRIILLITDLVHCLPVFDLARF